MSSRVSDAHLRLHNSVHVKYLIKFAFQKVMKFSLRFITLLRVHMLSWFATKLTNSYLKKIDQRDGWTEIKTKIMQVLYENETLSKYTHSLIDAEVLRWWIMTKPR